MKLDNSKTLHLHAKLIKEKRYLYLLYDNFYDTLLNLANHNGKIVELGSGAGFIKEKSNQIITSDIVKGRNIDLVFNAIKLPFRNKSIATFLMFDVLHHIKDPQKALREIDRCLILGGKIVMIEPYNSIWGRFIYQHFHHEDFDPQAGWKTPGRGRLSAANGAIPWIIFERDRKKFVQKFPHLKINQVYPHTPLLYLISGGLTFPQLLPIFLFPAVKFLEKILSPLNKYLGMFVIIELTKI